MPITTRAVAGFFITFICAVSIVAVPLPDPSSMNADAWTSTAVVVGYDSENARQTLVTTEIVYQNVPITVTIDGKQAVTVTPSRLRTATAV